MLALLSFLFPPPPSLLVSAVTIITVPASLYSGISEARGKNLQYSKFWNVTLSNDSKQQVVKLSSRAGMFLVYAPAFLAAVASLALYPSRDLRFLLVSSALVIHFFKRCFEVLFVHKYSSSMVLDSAIVICLGYLSSTVLMIYSQYLVGTTYPEPATDLKFIGVPLFLLGICGNFYHHYLLSKLRGEGNEYKIPKGGLFGLVICPHYLFEILAFVGVSFIAQTPYSLSFTMGTIFYLTGRSYATRRWYRSKFEDFPDSIKALIPFVF